jgi:hypothetical protein
MSAGLVNSAPVTRSSFLQRARAEQKEPGRVEYFRTDWPIVELKIAHFREGPGRSEGTYPRGRFG